VIAELPHAELADQERACEKRAILVSLSNLMTFPWIRERVERGNLNLHGWYFDIKHGQLLRYETATREYIAM
jgi:carbonic anhydrase